MLLLTFPQAHPAIAGDVRNGIGVTGEEGVVRQLAVSHAVETAGLLSIAFLCVRDLLRRVLHEVVVLTEHGANPTHLPHKPLVDDAALAVVLPVELATLLREVDQDRPAFEQGQRLAVRTIVIDNCGNAVVRGNGEELWPVLLALADVDRMGSVFQPGFFEHNLGFPPVGGRRGIKVDHLAAFSFTVSDT